MNKNIAKIQSKGWQKIAQTWQKMTSPSRPSLGDVQIYGGFVKQIIKDNRNYRILVLGSTPELRNLILKLGLSKKTDLYILDINSAMIQARSSFLELDAVKEQRIIGDWLNMPFKDNFFDIVLGDEILINVVKDDRNELLQEIYRVLKSGGAFITRASHVNSQAKKFTVRKSFDKYTKLYLQNKLTFNQALNYLFEEIFELSFFRNKKKLLLIKVLLPEISKEMKATRSTKGFMVNAFVHEYRALFNQCWSWESKIEQIKRFKKYFSIQAIKSAKDYLYAYILPIYFLRKR
jgi:SAM-dependent methyltransferase